VFLILSCSRFKRADYLLPAYPGLAVFLGCLGERWLHVLADKPRRLAAGGLAGLVAIMVVVWFVRVEFFLSARESYRDYRAFAAHVRRLAPRPDEVIFFRTEAHPLAFHVGRPLTILVEWPELNARLRQPGTHYLVTPPNTAQECAGYLPNVHLETVAANTDLSGGRHEHPLVVLRAAAYRTRGRE
jgi:hypothetical protein